MRRDGNQAIMQEYRREKDPATSHDKDNGNRRRRGRWSLATLEPPFPEPPPPATRGESTKAGWMVGANLGVEGEEFTRSLTDLGEGELDAPDLALTPQAVLTAELELLVKTLLLEGATRSLEGL